MEHRITDDLQELLRVLPANIREKLESLGKPDTLLEVVLDLGRIPTARYTTGEVPLADHEVTRAEIDSVVAGVGMFDADNRAGMERTLHRISAIRNRRGEVVGLTCRVGRAVYGTIDIIKDLIETGQSILLLGSPGVGKTTMLREAARVLAETKRVVIVDTSNEIGGDGDVPHPAVGRARRMQVSHPEQQHEVMIEAVENHNPEVIVIDEIGRELEATAARTIAERGVQLIGTAHGNALENLLLNPTLSDLVGGIQAVTLSDEEARRRGTQKTVLERRAPPTFDVLVEIQTRDRLVVIEDVAAAVDLILRERPLQVEIRTRSADGEINIETSSAEVRSISDRNDRMRDDTGNRGGTRMVGGTGRGRDNRTRPPAPESRASEVDNDEPSVITYMGNGANGRSHAGNGNGVHVNASSLSPMKIYAYGVARNRLQQAARRLRVPVTIVDDEDDANMIVTLKNYYRRRPKLIVDAERTGTSVYVLRANTVSQMENFLIDVFQPDMSSLDNDMDGADPFSGAMRETKEAIMRVRSGTAFIDLAPQSSTVRRRQHDMARRASLQSISHGEEPDRRVRIYRGGE